MWAVVVVAAAASLLPSAAPLHPPRTRPLPARRSAAASDVGGDSLHPSQLYADLVAWLRSFPDGYVHPSVDLRPSTRAGGGYGAFASSPLAGGEELLRIPSEACVTVSDALGDPLCGGATEEFLRAHSHPPGRYVLPTTAALAGYLAKEWLLMSPHTPPSASSRGASDEIPADGSRFGPYLRTLPFRRGVNGQEHALFWSEGEVKKLPVRSRRWGRGGGGGGAATLDLGSAAALREEVGAVRFEARSAVRAIGTAVVGPAVRRSRGGGTDRPVGAERAGTRSATDRAAVMTRAGRTRSVLSFPRSARGRDAGAEAEAESIDDALTGALVSVLSRSFAVDAFEERMIPVLDVLNHDANPLISQSSDDFGNVAVRALFDIAEGEELFNRYAVGGVKEGGVTAQYFFTRFGFLPDDFR